MLVFSKVYVTSLNSMQVVYSFFGVYSLSTYLQDNNFFSSLKLQTTTTITNFWRQMWPTRWYICILLSLNKMTNQHSLHSTKQNSNFYITVYFVFKFSVFIFKNPCFIKIRYSNSNSKNSKNFSVRIAMKTS